MPTPVFAVAGIDHVVLRVADVPGALAFYEGVLGCALERQQADIGLWQLRAGAALIDLIDVNSIAGRRAGAAPSREGRNVDHIALKVRPFDDATLRAHLSAHGVAIEGASPDNYGAQGPSPALYIRDPEGTMIELMGPGCDTTLMDEDGTMTTEQNIVHTPGTEWIALREGLSFRPLHFSPDGYAAQLRIEPGTVIARHRHTGHVHAINLSGWREIVGTGERIGPGDYVYEPPGNVDSWRCTGDEPCIVHLSTTGRVEYLDDEDNVITHSDTHTMYAAYLAWRRAKDVAPAPAPGKNS